MRVEARTRPLLRRNTPYMKRFVSAARVPLTLIALRSIAARTIVFEGVGGVKPYTIDFGDGTAPVDLNDATLHTYDTEGDYTASVTDAEGTVATVDVTADELSTEFVVLWPQDGATLPPVYRIAGQGGVPGQAVNLFSQNQDPANDQPISTVTAGSNGLWGFLGDTPQPVGVTTWTVTTGELTAPTVTVTVEAEDDPADDDEAEDPDDESDPE